MRPVLTMLLLSALCLGCGAGYQRLPDSALRDLPLEGRRWLYDAENTVVAALDAVDVAQEARGEASERVAAAERGVDAARQQERRRGTPLGVTAAQQRLALAQSQRALAEGRVALARLRVRRARLELELDKARLVAQYDLVAERGFSLQPFEAQAAEAQRQLDAQQKAVDALAQKAQGAEDQARLARQAYIAKSGDYDSGVWLE